jgi:hypothetical protein
MGLHFNGYNKKRLGWLGDGDVLNISTSGNYVIDDFDSTAGKRLALITNPSHPAFGPTKPLYALEYRSGNMKYDSALLNPSFKNNTNGLIISNMAISGDRPYLVDANPTNKNWYEDIQNKAVLSATSPILSFPTIGISKKGDNLNDPAAGIHIYNIKKVFSPTTLKNQMQFSVDIDTSSPCVTSPHTFYVKTDPSPGLSLLTDPNTVLTETSMLPTTSKAIMLFVMITNGDSLHCSSSNFKTSGSLLGPLPATTPLPSGEYYSWFDSATTIYGKQTYRDFAEFQFIEEPVPGDYIMRINVTNLATTAVVTKDILLHVLDPAVSPL